MTLGEGFTLAAYVIGFCVFFWAARSSGFDRDAMLRLGAVGLLGGLVGARIAQHVLGEGSLDALLSTQAGGRTILAGVLTGWLAVELAKRAMGLRRSTGTAFALALASGEAVGRIGCHFNECCYGREWDGTGAVFQHGAERFPSQLVSSAYALTVFALLLWMRKRLDGREMFGLYLLLFAGGRFLIEFTREGSTALFGLTMAQWVCIELLVTVVAVHVWSRHKTAKRVST